MPGSIQGANKVDSWAQFVNLVQDARTRNQAVSGAKGAQAAGQVRDARRISQAIAAAPRRADFSPAAVPVAPGPPREMTKAIGSFFDAYA